MANTIELVFTTPPSLLPCYLRILLSKRSGFKEKKGLPHIRAIWKNARIDSKNLSTYLAICDLLESKHLPFLYPHVIVSPLHMNILTHPSFPVKLLGSVHLRNHIVQHRDIKINEEFKIFCETSDHRVMEKGLEFDLNTIFYSGEERVWEEISTFFVQGKHGQASEPSPIATMEPLEHGEKLSQWYLPRNSGRRYAKVTGDYNPIHVSKLLAKAFGFERDLIHGFCCLAQTLGKMSQPSIEGVKRLDVAFKGPLYLENQVMLKNQTSSKGNRFDVFCGKNPRPSICGQVSSEPSGFELVQRELQGHNT